MMILEINNRFLNKIKWLTISSICIISFIFYNIKYPNIGIGIFYGGLIGIIHFFSIERDVKILIKAINHGLNSSYGSKIYVFKFYIRLLMLGIILFFLIKSYTIHPIGLIIGYSLIVFNILFYILAKIFNSWWLKLREG